MRIREMAMRRALPILALAALLGPSALGCEDAKKPEPEKKPEAAPSEPATETSTAETGPAATTDEPGEPATAAEPGAALALPACKAYAQRVSEVCIASVRSSGGGVGCGTAAFMLASILETPDAMVCESFEQKLAEEAGRVPLEAFALEGSCAPLVDALEARCLKPIADQGGLPQGCDEVVSQVEVAINNRVLPVERCDALRQQLDAAVPAAQ